jgi:hypothetical protein
MRIVYRCNKSTGYVAVFYDWAQWATRNIEAKGFLSKSCHTILVREATDEEKEVLSASRRLCMFKYGNESEFVKEELELEYNNAEQCVLKMQTFLNDIGFKWNGSLAKHNRV